MRDFTPDSYRHLLSALRAAGYRMMSYETYKDGHEGRCAVLRHDVDKEPWRSVAIARLEHEAGVRASYYFRVVPCSNDGDAIRAIADLGHEIGYHYEDLALCSGDNERAIRHFEDSLAYFRRFYPVRTICMHGAPTSRYDGRDLWKRYDYKSYGITGEPYLDTDFGKMLYLTDTGGCWDGYKVSVRDKIPQYQDEWIRKGLVFHTTDDVIRGLLSGKIATDVMLTTHPQRWPEDRYAWIKERLLQKVKNVLKRCLTHGASK